MRRFTAIILASAALAGAGCDDAPPPAPITEPGAGLALDPLPPSASADAPAPTEAFVPGQVWRYRTRPGEEGSRVHVARVEAGPDGGIVVHVKVTGVVVPRPGRPDPGPEDVYHLPMAEAALRASVLELTADPLDIDGFVAGYRSWTERADAGEAMVFDLTVAEVLQMIEARMNGQE